MATTFAIVAVFVPIAFMSGIIGRFFFQFGVTVAVAVLVSLFVSFTLDPDALVGVAGPAGVALLARALARPRRWIASSAASTGCTGSTAASSCGRCRTANRCSRSRSSRSSAASFVVPLVGTEFMPEVDQGFISLRLNTPVGSSLDYFERQGASRPSRR